MPPKLPLLALAAHLLFGLIASANPDARPTSLAPNRKVEDFDAFPAAAKREIRPRAVSDNVAAQLAARMPQYTPPPELSADAEPPTNLAQNEEGVDLPRNQILRLPDYIVREKKPPVFRERDTYNSSGLATLAWNRYLSETAQALNRFTLPLIGGGAQAYALARYQEDERLRNMQELGATARDIGTLQATEEEGRAAETALRRLIRETYTHRTTEASSKLAH